jgi:hypothetical protein
MKKRILTVVLFLALLAGILSLQVVRAQAENSSTSEQDALIQNSPNTTIKYVNLTNGAYEVQLPNENETIYPNGTIGRNFYYTLTDTAGVTATAVSTSTFSIVHYGVPQDTEQDISQELSASILVFLCFGNAALMLDKLNVHLPIEIRETPKRIAQYFLPRARS